MLVRFFFIFIFICSVHLDLMLTLCPSHSQTPVGISSVKGSHRLDPSSHPASGSVRHPFPTAHHLQISTREDVSLLEEWGGNEGTKKRNKGEKGGETWEPWVKQSSVVIPAFTAHHLSDTSTHSSNGIIHTWNQLKNMEEIKTLLRSCSSGLIMEVREDGNTATMPVKPRLLVNYTFISRLTANPGGIRDGFWMMVPQTGVSADKEKSKSWPHGDEEPTLL